MRVHGRRLAFYRSDADAATRLLAVREHGRDAGIDPDEHAALASVCLAILVLDAALTRK